MAAAPERRTRFELFLNPYEGMAFTRCPICDAKTKLRKLPLAIHIEPATLCMLNKTCRFCAACELVIVRKSELEPLLVSLDETRRSAIDRGEYTVFGTLDRTDWRLGRDKPWTARKMHMAIGKT